MEFAGHGAPFDSFNLGPAFHFDKFPDAVHIIIDTEIFNDPGNLRSDLDISSQSAFSVQQEQYPANVSP